MHYTAPLSDHPTLAPVTVAADRAQTLLDILLTDIEQLPGTSIQFRLRLLNKVTTIIYRLTSIRKTMVALRAQVAPHVQQLRALTGMLLTIQKELTTLRQTLPPGPGGTGSPTGEESVAQAPANASLIPNGDLSLSPGLVRSTYPGLTTSTPQPQRGCGPNGSPTLSRHEVAQPEPALLGSHPTTTPTPRMYKFTNPQTHAHPNGKYSPTNLPTPEDLIKTPRLPRNPQPTIPTIKLDQPPTQPATHNPQPAFSSPSQPATRNPQPATAASAVDALAARLPPSLTYTPSQFPTASNTPAIYAPYLDLDLVPHVNTAPTLPLHTPDLETQLISECTNIGDTIINTRATIVYKFTPKPKPDEEPLRDPYGYFPDLYPPPPNPQTASPLESG